MKALEEEAKLTLLGRVLARSEIARALEGRLRVEDVLTRHPEIEAQEVAPVHVVTGLGRSGTSLLHELFTLDADNRVPMQWEMMYPVPPPETAICVFAASFSGRTRTPSPSPGRSRIQRPRRSP